MAEWIALDVTVLVIGAAIIAFIHFGRTMAVCKETTMPSDSDANERQTTTTGAR